MDEKMKQKALVEFLKQPRSLRRSEIGDADRPQTTIERQKKRIVVPEYSISTSDPLLVGAYKAYNGRCTCGIAYNNNCAHFLSDAFKRQYWQVTFPSSAAKCPHGRLIRAKELLDWFRAAYNPSFSQNHNGINSGYWLVYQEQSGQGHVCIHKHQGGFGWVGTGDYPSWPVQWHYYH